MNYVLGLVLAVGLSAGAVAVEDRDDGKAVQGTWVPIEAELAGKPMPEAVLKSITLKTGDGKYEVAIANTPESDKGTYTLGTASNPKTMTIKSAEGPNAGKTLLAIYELKNDTMRVCYDLSGTKHPQEFKTTPGSKLYLVKYKRHK